ARGTHNQTLAPTAQDRFIPAGAGNTSWPGCCDGGGAVYPRWRGEHPAVAAISCADIGLSPLARGTLAAIVVALVRMRFIPAGAGNT
ncbi:hypothetical protein AEW13_23500, partial [Salmonella enterica subsp. enterica serovar Albany]